MADPVTIDLRHVARGLGIPLRQVEAVVELLDDGNTVPFITRYRKDPTGGLDEEQVRLIQARLKKLRLLAERKETILRSIESQGKLTEKLARQIHAAGTTKRLEDLYLPFKPKKQTLATVAHSRGLEPLAGEILRAAVSDLDARAKDYADPDRQVPTAADALLGAGHILAEQFSERAELRHRLREILQRTGKLVSIQVAPEPKPAVEKGEKQAGGREPASGRAESPAQGSTGTMTQLASASAPSSLAEEVAAVWTPAAALLEETVVSHDTAEPVEPHPSAESSSVEKPEDRGDAAPQASPDPLAPPEQEPDAAAAFTESLALAELPQGAGPQIGVEVIDTIEPSPGTAGGQAVPGGSAPVAAPPARIASTPRRLSKAEQLREKKEQKKKRIEERRQKAFRDYYSYSEEIRKIPPHRVLAINRGERARVLRVKLESDLEAMYQVLDELCVPPEHPHAAFLRGCARDALTRLILPSLERDIRRELTERAELHAVGVFARNLRNLLLASPVRDRRVLAVDPGYKSGCKLVALDPFGNVLAHDVIYLVGKPERRQEARRLVAEMIEQHQLTVVAIGNGTACRHTEDLFGEMMGEELKDKATSYVIVNEAGASVYSTSRTGREEFPQFDASARGAISIGRRLQDPLSELVKIDPANLGVGLYQHDVKANHLRESLDEVVESCVNYVGVDVNTASPALLRYVSGLNQLTARRVYEHRLEHGPFRSREQLKEVPGVGDATFVQAAGFLKIVGGDNPLDATWIHPESYPVATRVMEKLDIGPPDLVNAQAAASLSERVSKIDVAATAGELQVGSMLLKDILAQLARPGRDPREDLPGPVFKRGVLKLEDLAPGMELTGTVLNVVDFGAFVDIGMHDSGLVHVSQMADRFVRDPHEVVTVGDIVRVWVLEVDKQRRRVSLTMIPPGHDRSGPRRHARPQAPARPQEQRPPQQARPEDRGSRESPPEHRRPERPRPPDRPREQRPPRSAERGPARPPKPRPITPITDDMKAGKEPMRSFSDLIQFYGLQSPPGGGKEQGRGRRDQEKRGKDAGRRKEPGRSPPEQEAKDAAGPPATQTPTAMPETSAPDPDVAQAPSPPDSDGEAPPSLSAPTSPGPPPAEAESAPAQPEAREPAEASPEQSAAADTPEAAGTDSSGQGGTP